MGYPAESLLGLPLEDLLSKKAALAAASTESPGKVLKKLRMLKTTPEQQELPPKPKDVLDTKRNLGNAFDTADAAGHKDPWDFVLTSFTLDSFVIFQRDPTSCTPNLKDPKECTLSAGFYHLICWNLLATCFH